MKKTIIITLSITLAGSAGYFFKKWQDTKKLAAKYEQILSAPPREPLLTVTNATFLNMGNAIVVKLSDSEWATITNAYPTNIQTQSLTFYKNQSK